VPERRGMSVIHPPSCGHLLRRRKGSIAKI
jgi:hypothetical protein